MPYNLLSQFCSTGTTINSRSWTSILCIVLSFYSFTLAVWSNFNQRWAIHELSKYVQTPPTSIYNVGWSMNNSGEGSYNQNRMWGHPTKSLQARNGATITDALQAQPLTPFRGCQSGPDRHKRVWLLLYIDWSHRSRYHQHSRNSLSAWTVRQKDWSHTDASASLA